MQREQEELTLLSHSDWASFGKDDVAYVRDVEVDGKQAFAVMAADGSPLFVAPSRDLAFAALIQEDLDPLSAH